MQITSARLRQIIKEELDAALEERPLTQREREFQSLQAKPQARAKGEVAGSADTKQIQNLTQRLFKLEKAFEQIGGIEQIVKLTRRVYALEQGRKGAMNELSAGEARIGSMESGPDLLAHAAFKVLVDGRNNREENPLALSTLFDSEQGAVIRYLRELGMDDRRIKRTMRHVRSVMGGGQFRSPDGDVFTLVPATVRVGPTKGERGLYLK